MTFPIRTTINAFGPAISWAGADRPGQDPGRAAPFAAPQPSADRAQPGGTAGVVDHVGLELGLAADSGLDVGAGLSLSVGVGLAVKLGLDLSLGPRAGGTVMPPEEGGTDLDPARGQTAGLRGQAQADGGPMRPLSADHGADLPTASGAPARLTAASADTGAMRAGLLAGAMFNAQATGGPSPRAGLVAGIGVRIGADQSGTMAGRESGSGAASGGMAAATSSAQGPAGTARGPGSAVSGSVLTGDSLVNDGMARQEVPGGAVVGAAGLVVVMRPVEQALRVTAPASAMPAPAGTDAGLSRAASIVSASAAPAPSPPTGQPTELPPEARPGSPDDATQAMARVQAMIPQFLAGSAARPTATDSPPAEVSRETLPAAEVSSAEAVSTPGQPQPPIQAAGAGDTAPAHPAPIPISARTAMMPANPRETDVRANSDGAAASTGIQPFPVATAAFAGASTASAFPQHLGFMEATGREAASNPLQVIGPDPAASPASASNAAASGQMAPDASGNGGAGLPTGSLTAPLSPGPAPTVALAANSVPLTAGIQIPTALGGPAILALPAEKAGLAAQPVPLLTPVLARRVDRLRGRRRDRSNLHGLWSILYVMGWGRRRRGAEPDDEADHETDETNADPSAGRSGSRQR
ncbi:hypothetical protein [Methylobacterium sp. ARG-1]|uniref:hypothetical protein n=1 Tax=Methylobacterium sp. ARG-1 TaxID=1692501 RepID=UPI000682EB01|nr:hypothetical protein [Methylobacterium sp. ARG-1]KNY20750.1 hypothetical protein AKJ13_20870 [Methylobacterium sp. ARG-1]